jgi:hypothetical protein
MPAALLAGLLYFATVFAVGFVLGVVRGLVLAPLAGELWAVAIELPVMLGVSWWVCGLLVTRTALPGTVPLRLLMGWVAFALLMLAELGVSLLLGRTPSDHLATYTRLPNLLGLFAQLLFALFPVGHLGRTVSRPRG